MCSYTEYEDVKGKVRELVINKLGSDPDADIQYGTETFTTTCGLNTCWDEWDEFIIVVNGNEVFRTRQTDSPFGELQNWLDSEDV